MSKDPIGILHPDRFVGSTEGYIAYKKGFKYQLDKPAFCATGIHIPLRIETDFIIMETNGDLWLSQWYAWDGASGPTIDGPKTMRLSAFHDALYQLIRLGLLPRRIRKKADKLMYRLGREDDMWKIRVGYWLKGVRWFAKSAADSKNLKPVLFAPTKKR